MPIPYQVFKSRSKLIISITLAGPRERYNDSLMIRVYLILAVQDSTDGYFRLVHM